MNKLLALYILLLSSSLCFAQTENYRYKRQLEGVSSTWHSILLPNDLYGKVDADLSDLRVLGISATGDTLEMPYLLQSTAGKTSVKEMPFRLLNQTSNSAGYYYTLELPEEQSINEIQLQFGNQNFDWRVKLEGSHRQNEWFTILENYRILSVENDYTDYSFTTLRFPTIRYKYLRLQINSSQKPELMPVTLLLREQQTGDYQTYSPANFKVAHNRKEKLTVADLQLPQAQPVSQLVVQVKDTFDYFRPFTLQYAADSSKLEEGWRYHYRTLYSGTLSSLEDPLFSFGSTIGQKFRLVVQNGSNLPLNIAGVQLKGPQHSLITRLGGAERYLLLYGNPAAPAPQYDIALFTDKIPASPAPLALGPEEPIAKNLPASNALFGNKLWLWAIMLILIGIMGWFALKMLRTDQQEL